MPNSRVQAHGGTDNLRQVCGHHHQLGLDPEAHHAGRGETFPADLSQIEPVAIASFALMLWISIAIRFAASTTQSSMYPWPGAAEMFVAKLQGRRRPPRRRTPAPERAAEARKPRDSRRSARWAACSTRSARQGDCRAVRVHLERHPGEFSDTLAEQPLDDWRGAYLHVRLPAPTMTTSPPGRSSVRKV